MHEASERGALVRWKLLQSASANPERLSATVTNSLRTQRSFAGLSIPDQDIHPLSLNCLKSAAEDVVEDGGWQRMDDLRRQIYSYRTRSKSSVRGRKPGDGVASDRDDLSLKLAEADRGRLRVTKAYMELLDLTSRWLAESGREALRRHRATWQEELGLRVVNGDQHAE